MRAGLSRAERKHQPANTRSVLPHPLDLQSAQILEWDLVRRSIQLALLLLLLVYIVGAPFETVDHWDNFAQGGNDLVLSVLSLVAGFGLILVVACLLRLALRRIFSKRTVGFAILPQLATAFLEVARPEPPTSPPLPLRI